MSLTKYDGKKFTDVNFNDGVHDKYSNQVFGVTEDLDGNILFGTATGALKYNPVSKTLNDF
jgi:hypothetical protein